VSEPTADVVVCGAGIAGIAAAHELAVERGCGDVLLVDPLPPLTLTSDKSAECYRNWWPGETMTRFMARSIDRLDAWTAASGNRFAMNRNGYAYLTADPRRAAELERAAREISGLGAGELRIHRGAADDPVYPETPFDRPAPELGGADFVTDRALILRRHPFLAQDVRAMLHPRRCGWLSAQQLGMYLLERARERGVREIEGRVVGIDRDRGRVAAVRVARAGGVERIATRTVVNAAGPHAREFAALAGLELPLFCELHGKVYLEDVLGVLPRETPLMIWCDPVTLDWDAATREALAGDPELAYLLAPLPGGLHFRPEGGAGSRIVLLIWTYHLDPVAPLFPPRFDPYYPEVVLRGLCRMAPGLAVYLERRERPFVDGGYYCKTRENRLLVGPTAVEGFHLFCGLSGYGIMASPAAAELLGAHLSGSALPAGAEEFLLARYADEGYRARLERGEISSGQL